MILQRLECIGFSVTCCLELLNVLSIYCLYLVYFQHMSNWLFGHYRTLTNLTWKNLHQQWKDIALTPYT